jgi:xanthine dehydrogenase FAD-binding subunit
VDSRLALVGTGPLEIELKRLAKQLGLDDAVIWAGFREDISIVMQAFDVFALTSDYEGFGLVLLEAMAARKPVVATGVSAIPEIVIEGETGLLSIHKIEALSGVTVSGDEVVIGATTTASDLVLDPVIREHVPILSVVADRLASAQIRNVATIGGNLANASPAGDLINPLLLLDATVVLQSTDGERRVAVAKFFTGPGATVRRPDELLTQVRVPIPPPKRIFRFQKAGTRPAMECSVVTVGVAFTMDDGVLRDVRVAFGSMAPVPLRGRKTEAVLEGSVANEATIEAAAVAAAGEVSPIDDVRGSAGYRTVLAAEFLRRLLRD